MNERDTLKINKQNHLEIGGVDCVFLAKKYGTPLYVYDKAYIENVCDAYQKTLNVEYGLGKISFASKSFCCKDILRTIKSKDLGVDVVSIGELKTALAVNFSPENIIFHGNNKSYKDLEFAIQNKVGLIVVDAYSELDDVNEIANRIGVIQNLLIRVNPGVEAHTHHYIQTANPDSKFGFSIGIEAINVIKKALDLKGLSLKGLHCHIGSQIFEEKSFEIATEKMIDFYALINNQLGVDFDILDLGGGFGIYYYDGDKKMNLSSYQNFIKKITTTLKNKIEQVKIKKPYLILEPGRSIVGEAGITLYTAGRIKEIKDLKNYIAIDGGMFENPRFALYQAKYSVVAAERMNNPATKTYTIAGKCCESGDIIAENVSLPEIKEGEILAVLSTGAYNYSMASNYNRNLVPAVVMVKDGLDYLAVKGQTYEDLLKNDL
ncbi:MAG: diaminopimelate decarboxylase [Clostridia bacterium]|nr:diaminopimelate decarboxylase [Clostridia bacterium]